MPEWQNVRNIYAKYGISHFRYLFRYLFEGLKVTAAFLVILLAIVAVLGGFGALAAYLVTKGFMSTQIG
jgi:hypothetical protein